MKKRTLLGCMGCVSVMLCSMPLGGAVAELQWNRRIDVWALENKPQVVESIEVVEVKYPGMEEISSGERVVEYSVVEPFIVSTVSGGDLITEEAKGIVEEVEVGVIERGDYYIVEMPYREKDFKSYMDYKAIGAWRQQDLQDVATTDKNGFRVVDGRYLIAVGTAVCEEVGYYVTLILENGVEIDCIVGDIKDDAHTNETRITTSANGCVSEFIIDDAVMEEWVLSKGNVSCVFEEWDSKVKSIKVENKNYFD